MPVKTSLTSTERAIRRWRRYLRSERGVTAIEFGFVAAPFIYLLCAILEVAAMFVANVMLDHGTMEAAREIRTLELQTAGGTASDFKKLVCDGSFGTLDCAGKMYVNVNTFEDFDAVDNNTPMKNGALDKASLNFDPGAGGSIVVARVYYEWQIMTPFIGAFWQNAGANVRLLQSAAAFRNEPS